jgi:predicted DNA-binding protein
MTLEKLQPILKIAHENIYKIRSQANKMQKFNVMDFYHEYIKNLERMPDNEAQKITRDAIYQYLEELNDFYNIVEKMGQEYAKFKDFIYAENVHYKMHLKFFLIKKNFTLMSTHLNDHINYFKDLTPRQIFAHERERIAGINNRMQAKVDEILTICEKSHSVLYYLKRQVAHHLT